VEEWVAEELRRRRKTDDDKQSKHPTEIFVGARIRMRRAALGMSRAELSAILGTTLAQVADLEDGRERVGVARLLQLSQVLSIPVAWFFEGLGVEAQVEFGGRLPPPEAVAREVNDTSLRELLVVHFDAIQGQAMRRLLVGIARSLADSEGQSKTPTPDRH
jgi:transcriptional regulator with XRE-family HTH domain